MPSLFDIGARRILKALEDDACPGLVVVVASPKANRIGLAACAIDECALTPAPGADEFRALYVNNHPPNLDAVREAVNRRRKHPSRRRRPLRDQIFEVKAGKGKLRGLREANYATASTIARAVTRFEPDSIELLVLDERAPGEMSKPYITALRSQVRPFFTLLITNFVPPPLSPWDYLGPPVILKGEAPRPAPQS